MRTKQRLEDFLSTAELDALFRPTAEAQGLPGCVYTDPDFLALERETLFRNTWVGVATASEIPDPGDAVPVNLAGYPLLVVRDEAGVIRCFYNICRHRGAALVREKCHMRGAIRCPWHGWTYRLDGTLRGTPLLGGIGIHEASEFDKTGLDLVSVTVAQWFDIVFVNLSGTAPPLETHLRPFVAQDEFDFTRLHQAGNWEMHYPGNWKLAIESGIEDYHFPFVHGQLSQGDKQAEVPHAETIGDDFFYLSEEASVWARGRARPDLPQLPLMTGLIGRDAQSLSFTCLFPTTVMYRAVDGAYVAFWLPEGHELTRMRFFHYFVDEGASAREYAATRADLIEQSQHTLGQDKAIIGTVQQGAHVRDRLGIRPRFSPFWESTVHNFQKRVIEKIREVPKR